MISDSKDSRHTSRTVAGTSVEALALLTYFNLGVNEIWIIQGCKILTSKPRVSWSRSRSTEYDLQPDTYFAEVNVLLTKKKSALQINTSKES